MKNKLNTKQKIQQFTTQSDFLNQRLHEIWKVLGNLYLSGVYDEHYLPRLFAGSIIEVTVCNQEVNLRIMALNMDQGIESPVFELEEVSVPYKWFDCSDEQLSDNIINHLDDIK